VSRILGHGFFFVGFFAHGLLGYIPRNLLWFALQVGWQVSAVVGLVFFLAKISNSFRWLSGRLWFFMRGGCGWVWDLHKLRLFQNPWRVIFLGQDKTGSIGMS